MSQRTIYLDYAAASPLDERVLVAIQPYVTAKFYNPSAAYAAARSIRKDIESARERIAGLLGAKSSELTYTAGATESIAICAASLKRAYPAGHMVTTTIDHPAVIESVKSSGRYALVPVNGRGRVKESALRAAITDDTTLVSVGYVNGELGTIQPLKHIARLIRSIRDERAAAGNRTPIYFHTDASQAIGHADVHVSRLGVDMMTLNAGKAYGPKQTGLLYAAATVPLQPYTFGGGQEGGIRSGTENVAGIIGMAEAFRFCEAVRAEETARLRELRRTAIARLQAGIPDVTINGDEKHVSPHILNISIPGADGERLLMELDERGIMVSTGSACAANRNTKSHVLTGIGLSDTLIAGSIRLSFGRDTTLLDIETATEALCELSKKHRERHYG